MRTAILGSVAVIATGVGVILLVRRLQRPALEKIAGGKKKRKPSLTRAKSVLRESRRKSDEPTEYAAFVSHMKAEAAMEARFLQIELESQTGEHVFLDSDDLRNLDKLVDHVKAARVLILVQTKSVLTRPYCLLEVLTAIDEGIPIVGVTVAGRPNDAYDFAETSTLLTHLDTLLERANPGAADLLKDHGYDVKAAAHTLSSVVPKAISVPLNVCASRNMLSATIDDLLETMRSASGSAAAKPGGSPPSLQRWLDARGPPPPAPGGASPQRRKARASSSYGESSPAAYGGHGATNFHGGGGGGGAAAAGAPDVPYVAGRALFDAAKATPALLPLAFLVQALANAQGSKLSAAAAPLERALLASGALAADAALAREIADAIESLVAAAAAAAKGGGGADEHALREAPHVQTLRGCVERLCLGPFEAAALDAALSGRPPPEAPPAARPPPPPTSTTPPPAAEAESEAVRQQKELLEMQNKVLLEQVAQMQSMMAQQQLNMQAFMNSFPQPPDEAERRIVLLKKRLMTEPQEHFRAADDVLQNLIMNDVLGPHCKAVMFNVIGEETQRTLGVCLALGDGRWVTTKDLPMLMGSQNPSRKATMCQYVVARGSLQTFVKGVTKDEECYMMAMFGQGAEKITKEFPGLLEADPKFKESVGEMSMMAPMMTSEADLAAMPATKRLATKLKKSLMNGAMGVVPGVAGDYLRWFSGQFAADDLTYIGAPVKCEGHTMGTVCSMYSGGGLEGPGPEIKAMLQRAADRLSDALEDL